MKRPIMRGKEKGKGTNNEIRMLIPSEIPIHNNCCIRNCLLLLNIHLHPSLYSFVIHYIHYYNLKYYKYKKLKLYLKFLIFVFCFVFLLYIYIYFYIVLNDTELVSRRDVFDPL